VTNIAKAMQKFVVMGRTYLLTQLTTTGLCFEFHQLRHGPSWAWTTACVGSTLSEFGFTPREILEIILSLRCKNGGWSYNPTVPADADSTLRVLQFLRKIGFEDKVIISQAEHFVALHQLPDGGISTYHEDTVRDMGYSVYDGWCSSHPCVTALAINQLRDVTVLKRASFYLQNRLTQIGPEAYWWRTKYYVLYEIGKPNGGILKDDPVEIALALLLKSKLGICDIDLVKRLILLQEDDGSLPPSGVFRIPRPNQLLEELIGDEEVVEDKKGIFSTCAAIVAVFRQLTLL